MAIQIKTPLSLYDGLISQIQDDDNVGKYYFTTLQYNYSNNNSIIEGFSQVFVNTSLGPMTLKLTTNASPGDIIKIIDIKKTFFTNTLEIDPQTNKLDDVILPKIYDINGSIIKFIYIDSDIGWISYIDKKSKAKTLAYNKYNISPGTFDRHGLAVCQSGLENTVKLASSGSLKTVPVVGIILKDDNNTVLVQTENIDKIFVQLDSNSMPPAPGQFVFLSETEEGYLTNIEPQFGIIHRLGVITRVVTPIYVLINFFPKPEYIQSECDLFAPFGSRPFILADAGDGFQIILDDSGHVWTYGTNHYGQLGLGHTEDQEHPRQIDYPCPIFNLACGDTHVLLLDSDYNIWSMGNNDFGQLGHSNDDDKQVFPTLITVNT